MNNDEDQRRALMDDDSDNDDNIEERREDRYQANKLTDLKFTLCFEITGFVFFAWTLLFRFNKKWQQAYDNLFIIFCMYILTLRIPITLINFYSIKYFRRESRVAYFFSILSELFQLGWAIYANFVYYDKSNKDWKFYPPAGVFMLYVYYVLYKVCIFLLVAFILIPCFIIQYCVEIRNRNRETRRKNNLIKRLVKEKFWPEHFQHDAECSICMENYQKNEEVIVLPCDDRHYFHSKWLKKWLKEDTSWPFWKDQITIVKINDQKNLRRSRVQMRKSRTNHNEYNPLIQDKDEDLEDSNSMV